MEEGKVYAIDINDPDKTINTFISGLYMPNGIAFHDGDLYVAEVHRVLKYKSIESVIKSGVQPEYSIISNYPTDQHHGWRYLVIGADDRIYVPIGAPCNVCDEDGYAVITSMKLDGTDKRIIANGIRNSVGMTFHPTSGELWFTDNGRDMLGDDIPPCELNKLSYEGEHFGFPFCHGNNIKDPQYGSLGQCSNITIPIQELGPHVAPLGLKFYTGDMFPEEYQNQVFIPERGSWNRSKKIGYRITMVTLDGDRSTSYQIFADGWMKDEKTLGRPVDLLVMKDGSMLVSDDHNGAIYRITYSD
jgi:glucose/arabinose dehydrogenase